MIARLLCGLALLLLCALGSATAEASEAAERRCDAGVATAATIREIAAEPEKWQERCVSVAGMSDGTMLFASVEAYYRARALTGGDRVSDPEDPERIGLVPRRAARENRNPAIRQATAIGRVGDCATLYSLAQEAAGDATIRTMGYCRRASGPVILFDELRRARTVRLVRRTGEEARAAYGSLVAAPAEWPHRAFVLIRAAAFLDALRSRDRAALTALHSGSFSREGASEDAAFALGPRSPFADLARGAGAPQTAIFLDRDLAEGRREPADVAEATICFCRGRDCSSLWPVAAVDADNRSERPYACTRLVPYSVSGGWEPVFVTHRTGRGLAEPQRGAIRRQSRPARR